MVKKFEMSDGRVLSMKEASAICKISYTTLWGRVNRSGMTLQQAMDTHVGSTHGAKGKQVYEGSQYTLKGLSELSGIDSACLQYRIKDMGLTVEQAISMEPLRVRKNNFKAVEYKGVVKPLTEWAKDANIEYSTLYMRLRRGDTVEHALETPCRRVIGKPSAGLDRHRFKHMEMDGVVHSLLEWVKLFGVRESLVRARLRLGWDLYTALTTSPIKPGGENRKLITYNDETHCIREWATILGRDPGHLSVRLKKFDYSMEKTLEGWKKYRPRNKANL